MCMRKFFAICLVGVFALTGCVGAQAPQPAESVSDTAYVPGCWVRTREVTYYPSREEEGASEASLYEDDVYDDDAYYTNGVEKNWSYDEQGNCTAWQENGVLVRSSKSNPMAFEVCRDKADKLGDENYHVEQIYQLDSKGIPVSAQYNRYEYDTAIGDLKRNPSVCNEWTIIESTLTDKDVLESFTIRYAFTHYDEAGTVDRALSYEGTEHVEDVYRADLTTESSVATGSVTSLDGQVIREFDSTTSYDADGFPIHIGETSKHNGMTEPENSVDYTYTKNAHGLPESYTSTNGYGSSSYNVQCDTSGNIVRCEAIDEISGTPTAYTVYEYQWIQNPTANAYASARRILLNE